LVVNKVETLNCGAVTLVFGNKLVLKQITEKDGLLGAFKGIFIIFTETHFLWHQGQLFLRNKTLNHLLFLSAEQYVFSVGEDDAGLGLRVKEYELLNRHLKISDR